MIPINLLPHRAARRKAQQQQFFVLAGMTLGLAAVIVFAVHTLFAQRIETQVERNKYLESEIVLLDKQIDEIRKLKEQTQALLARKRVVESLQTNRTETVRLLDQLVRQPQVLHACRSVPLFVAQLGQQKPGHGVAALGAGFAEQAFEQRARVSGILAACRHHGAGFDDLAPQVGVFDHGGFRQLFEQGACLIHPIEAFERHHQPRTRRGAA